MKQGELTTLQTWSSASGAKRRATTKDEASPLDLNETTGLCIGQGNYVGELDEQKKDEVGDVPALTQSCCVVPGSNISS